MKTKININFKRGLRAVSMLALGLAALVPAANCFAWGPERPTYTLAEPADHVTFNSITNNPIIGDEREFVWISEEVEGQDPEWHRDMTVEPGKKYTVMIYYHNNAATNLNALGKGMATNARIKAQYPTTINAKNKGKVYAEISADNSNPLSVWDESYLSTTSEADVVLKLVTASAKIHNKGQADGQTLSETNLFSNEGILLGYNQLIGNLPGCEEYAGWITYTLYAQQVGAKVTKTVSTDGVNYFTSVKAQPGDKIYYRVEFENIGTSDLSHVTFHDKLPTGVTLVPGTTMLVNAANPNGIKMADTIGQNGFQTGLYGPKATAVLTYQVTINSDALKNANCGDTNLLNQIFVDHDEGEIYASSTVTLTKTCEPGTPPSLPETGPVEIALSIIAIVCIGTGVAYWYHSQQEVAKLTKKVTGKGKEK